MLAVAAGGGAAIADTPLASTAALSGTTDATENAVYLTGRQAATGGTGTPGALTVGWQPGTGGTSYAYAWAALEILPGAAAPAIAVSAGLASGPARPCRLLSLPAWHLAPGPPSAPGTRPPTAPPTARRGSPASPSTRAWQPGRAPRSLPP